MAEEERLQIHRQGRCTAAAAWGERLSTLVCSACGVRPVRHLSLFFLGCSLLFKGKSLEPISVTAVCLRTAVSSVKNLIFGNTLLGASL